MQQLPFETVTQFTALALTLIAGWFLGLATRSGGRRWRDQIQDIEYENAGYRDRAEQDLRDSARRIRDLEAENARLRAAAPAEPVHGHDGHSTAALIGAATVGAAAGAVAAHAAESHGEPVAAHSAEPAHH